MITRRATPVLWLSVLACQLSCGDSSGGGSGVVSGLPAEQKLSSLDGDDAKKLCLSFADGLNNVISASERKNIQCASLAIPLSVTETGGELKGDITKCKQLVDRCLSGETISEEDPIELDAQLFDPMQCDSANVDEDLSSCEATVANFESCAGAVVNELSHRLHLISCDSLSDIENVRAMISEDFDTANLAQCDALETSCPDLQLVE